MLAGIVLLLVTASAFFLSLLIFRVLTTSYEQYKERYLSRAANDFGGMVLFIDPKSMLVLNLSTMVFMGIFGYIFLGSILGVVAAIFGFFLPMILTKSAKKRRIKKFNTQLVDALQAMSNAFKAGLTFPQAAEQIGKEAPSPLNEEFSVLVRELKFGVTMEEAMTNMSRRVGSDDLDLVVTSTNIARQLGGNMAEMFETLAATIRERFRLEGKIESITSQGQLQGWIVSAMPVLMGLVLNAMRPDLMQPMLNHFFGWILVAIIVVMEFLGIMIIRRIVAIDV